MYSSHPLFQREIPGFGFNTTKIIEAAPKDCPEALLELALDCVQDSPERRPIMKDILTRLKKIEASYKSEIPGEVNVGTIGGEN